mmetsp:Transcript_3787/g.2513  ORF Transcript_3787/g.2513 Transcript_3787/m.2513 type:complete len:106 (+) Transcript_3787:134-451(+)
MSLQKIPPTIGLNIAKIEKRHGEYTFWDVGGQASLRKIWNKYFTECDGVIFVIDGSDSKRFEEVKTTLQNEMYSGGESDLSDLPCLFMLNKNDKKDFLAIDDIIF